jgi:hypothetical protein
MHNLQIIVKLSVIAAVFVSCTSDFDDIPKYEDIIKDSDVKYCVWQTPSGGSGCSLLVEVGEEFCADFGTIVYGSCDGEMPPSSSSSEAVPLSSSSSEAILSSSSSEAAPSSSSSEAAPSSSSSSAEPEPEEQYCKYELLGQQCDEINEGFTVEQCNAFDGEIVNSCP